MAKAFKKFISFHDSLRQCLRFVLSRSLDRDGGCGSGPEESLSTSPCGWMRRTRTHIIRFKKCHKTLGRRRRIVAWRAKSTAAQRGLLVEAISSLVHNDVMNNKFILSHLKMNPPPGSIIFQFPHINSSNVGMRPHGEGGRLHPLQQPILLFEIWYQY